MDRLETLKNDTEGDASDQGWCIDTIERLRKEKEWCIEYWATELSEAGDIDDIEKVKSVIRYDMQQALEE